MADANHSPVPDRLSGRIDRVPPGVWRSSAGLGLGRLFGAAATAAELVFAARLLGPAEFGRWTFLLAALILVEALADLGTGAAALQRGAKSEEAFARALTAARRSRRLTAAGAAIALLAVGLGLGQDLFWLLVACLLPLSRIAETSGLVFQRSLRWGPVIGARVVGALARGLLVPILLVIGVRDVGLLLAVHAAALALGNLLVHVAARTRQLLPPAVSDRAGSVALWSLALPLGLASLAHQAALYADNWILWSLRDGTDLGRYNAAARIASFLLLFAVNAGHVALPWLARARTESKLGSATANLGRGLLWPAALVLGLLLPQSDLLLAAAFGPSFASAATSLQVLLLSVLVVHATAGWLTALVAHGSGRAVLLLTSAALIANILGNLLLVPPLGGPGAALATLGTELLLSCGAWVTLQRHGHAPPVPLRLWRRAGLLWIVSLLVSAALRMLLGVAN